MTQYIEHRGEDRPAGAWGQALLATLTRKQVYFSSLKTLCCEWGSILMPFPGWTARKYTLLTLRCLNGSLNGFICQPELYVRGRLPKATLDPAELEMSSSSCCQTASISVCFLRPRLEELSFVHSVIHAEVLIECLWHARHSSRLWRSCSGKKKW